MESTRHFLRSCLQFLETKATLLVILMIVVFSVLYSALSVLHHMHFLSGGFDQGIFDQAVWQYAHFLFPYNTIKEKFILADHLTLTLPLLAPLLWIWDDVRILLVTQAVWVSVSAFPVYLYLQKRSFTKLQSLGLSFVYLLFYGMQYLVYFDFHSVFIAVGLMPWVLYFWETRRWRLFAISAGLLLLTQENMGLALFALCLLWFFQGKARRKQIYIIAAISLVYTAIAFFAIHLISGGNLQYVPHFPKTISGYVTQFFDVQDKRDVWLFSFSWYSFLPLLSPGALLAVISDLSQYFITGAAYNHTWSPYLHHRAILSLYLLVGTADVLLFIKKRISPSIIVTLLVLVAIFCQFHYHFALNKLVKKDYDMSAPWMSDNYDMLLRVPKDASVVAQQSLVPHLSHRQYIYLAYPRQHQFVKTQVACVSYPCWWIDFVGRPKYLVVDTHPGVWLTMTLAPENEFREAIDNMIRNNVLTLYYQKNAASIYMINYPKLNRILGKHLAAGPQDATMAE